MPLMRLSESDEAEMFAHAVYTQDMQANGRGHYTNDPHLVGVFNRTAHSGTGMGFDGTQGMGAAENLAWNYLSPDVTPEEMADRMIAQYIDEWPYLDWTDEQLAQEGEQNGHLQTLLRDGTLAFSSFCYIYNHVQSDWYSYYQIITAENYSWVWR